MHIMHMHVNASKRSRSHPPSKVSSKAPKSDKSRAATMYVHMNGTEEQVPGRRSPPSKIRRTEMYKFI